MIRRMAFVTFVAACSRDTRQAAEVRQSRDSVLTGEVVKALATPVAPGRIIYDQPTDLSADSLRVRRPDLVFGSDRRK